MEGDTDNKLNAIFSFEGKRNAVLTFLWPSDFDFRKQISSIEQRIKAIKHKNKAFQSSSVIALILQKNEERKKTPYDMIVCCGMNEKGIEYFELHAPKGSVAEAEYFHDFCFHNERIREVMYSDVITVEEKEDIEDLLRLCGSNSPLLLLGKKEVMENLNEIPGQMHKLFLIDEDVSDELIKLCRSGGCKISKMRCKNQSTKDFKEKWGGYFGIKRY